MKPKSFLLITTLSVLALSRFSSAGTPVFQNGGKQIQTYQLDVGWNATPAQVDWDGDGLRDLVIGDKEGYVWFYRNSGTEFNPRFTTGEQIKDSTTHKPINVGGFATPFVIDFDNNGKYDLIVGNKLGILTLFPMTANPPYVDSPRQMSLTNNTLRGVYFIDNQTGWIVGDNGVIFHTVDGGDTWMLDQSNTNENINSVHFLSSNEGWAVGNNSTILHYYIPAGQTIPIWESQPYGSSTNFHSVCFVDANNGWAVGDNGVIVHYANGSWTTQPTGLLPETPDLHSVFFLDAKTGWIVGEKRNAINRTILQTTDGGTNWAAVSNIPATIPITDFYSITRAPGTNYLWIVGANGTIVRYDFVTPAWTNITPIVNTKLYSVHFIDQNNGWIVGANGTILQYVNGNWTNVPSGVPANLYSVFFKDANHGWAVGDDSTILFYNGAGWGIQALNIDVGFNSAPFMFDLDEDGKKDLFVGDDPGNVWFFKNVGSDDAPAFRYGFRMSVGSQAQTGTSTNFIDVGQFATPQIADWTGDGTKDLIIGNGEGNVFLFKGVVTTGTSTQGLIPLPGNRVLTFEPGVKIQADKADIDVGQRSAPLVMDWNKDGGLDLLVGAECGVIHLFLNDNPYQPPQFTLSSKVQGSPPTSLQIGAYSTPAMVDFDDDSRKDLLVGDEDGNVTLFLNSGTDKDPIFTGGFELKVYGTSADKGTVAFTDNLNVGGFARPFPIDWNNDGKKDLIVGNKLGQVIYFRNIQSDKAPLFAPGAIIQIGSPTKTNLDVGDYATPVVVDWNNDGRKDLVIGQGDGNVYLALNIGTDDNPVFGTLTKLNTPDSEIDVGKMAVPFVIDYNGDHKKDLIVGDSDGYLTLFLNIGTDKAPILDKGKRLRIEGQGDIDVGENAAPWVVDYDNSNSLDLVVGNNAGFVNLYLSSGIVDLYLTKSVDKTYAFIGDTLNYTIEYGNRGDFNADNVEITDEIPSLTEFMGPAEGISTTILYSTNGTTWTGEYSTATTKIKWVRNELLQGAVGQKVSFKVRVVGTGTIENFADIESDQTYLQSSNIVTVIGTEAGMPDFSTAQKSVYPEEEILPGTVLTFTIKYQNTGNGTATNIWISDIIDANLCNVEGISNNGVVSNGTIIWNLGTIAVEHGGEVRFNATVFAPLPAGVVIENMATITAAEGSWQTNKVQLTIPQTESESNDWPMFHFNLSHEGYDFREVIRPPLQLKWTGTLTSPLRSSPVIDEGNLYLGSGDKVYVFDAVGGNLVGSYATGAYIDSTPAIVKDRVYAANSTGWVYCWGTNATGLKWAKYLGSNISLSSCAVSDGILYIGGLDGKLYARSTGNGDRKWVYPTNGVIQSSPAVANGRVYVGSADGNLYCLTTAGGLQWKFGTVGAIYSSPAVKDGVVYVGSDDKRIYAIDAYSGTKKWEYSTGGEVHSSPAIADGVIFCGSRDGYLYAINQSDGSLKWAHLIGSWIDSSPAVANGAVYFGADDGKIYGLDVTDDKELWKYDTGSAKQIYSSPAIVNGILYIADSAGKVYAFTSQADFSNPNLNKKLGSAVGTVQAGDEITYTIKFYNEGLGEATNFKIEDTLNPYSTFTSASGNGTHSNGVVTWDIGTVSPNSGGSVILKVKVGTDTPMDTVISNLARFTWNIGSGTTNVVSNKVIKEILTLLKVVNIQGDKVKPGDSLSYTISYKNNGTAPLTGINIVDKVNPCLTNINPANSGANNGGTITWQISALAPNGSGSVGFTSQVVFPLNNSTPIPNNTAVFNSAQIPSTPIPAQPGTLTVTSPDFRTSVKGVTGTFTPGETVTYVINYVNNGSLTATGIEIWDVVDTNLGTLTLPSNATYNPDNRTIKWNLGQVVGSVSFKATIKSPLPNGTLIKNKATIKASGMPDFVTNEVVGTVSSTPDFSYSNKEASPQDSIPLNKILTYTINYRNTGSMDAGDVVVIDRLDPHLTVSTVTSYEEVITGPGTVNLMVNNGWTQFDNGTVNGNITIVTPNGTHTTSIGDYSQVQLLINNINNNTTAPVHISYNPDTDRFTLQSLDGCIIGLYESGTNPFFTAIKIPTGIYCSGNYSNGTITWGIGQVRVGEEGSVTFKAMVIGTPTNGSVSNQAIIGFFGTICVTNEVSNTVDTTPPPAGSPPIEGSSTTDLDANVDGSYTVYWQDWGDAESGIARYAIQETNDKIDYWTTLSDTIPGNIRYFEVRNRVKGNTYYYRLRAMNGAGIWSAYSASSDGICIVDQLEVVNPATTTIISFSPSPPLAGVGGLLPGQVVIEIPQGAFASTVTFTLRKVSPPSTDLNKSSPMISAILNDSAFELKALKEDYNGVEVQPVNPIIVTLPYSDPDTKKEDDDLAYRIYRLAGDHWEIIPGAQTIDPGNDLITAEEVKQLSSIFAVAAPTIHLQNVLVRPNPYKSRLGHTYVRFENLPGKVSLWLYNIAGELVFNKDITGTYYEWPIVNNKGDRVASGVYIYIITNELGEKVTGKVAIIK